jgi:S1-C subfamily serine protease
VAESFQGDPGLAPGDVLLRWNGTPVRDTEEFGRLYDAEETGARVDVLAQRGGRGVAARFAMPEPGCRPYRAAAESWPALGLTLRWEPAAAVPGWTVVDAAPDGRAARAGVAAGDRIVAVQGRSLDGAGPPRLGPAAVVLTVRRARRADLVVVPAEP